MGVNREGANCGGGGENFPHACGGEPGAAAQAQETAHFPHACGGEPNKDRYAALIEQFSPRMWG